MEKIHDKIKQTTNTVKSLWNKEKRKTSTSAINTNQMQIPNLGIKNLRQYQKYYLDTFQYRKAYF